MELFQVSKGPISDVDEALGPEAQFVRSADRPHWLDSRPPCRPLSFQ